MTTCYVITNSYGQQSPSFADIMCARLGWTLTMEAQGGTGFLAGTTYRSRVPAALAAHPDIVMVVPTITDRWFPVADVTAEALLCIAALASVPRIYVAQLCVATEPNGPTTIGPYAAALEAVLPTTVHFINGVGWINAANAVAYEAADQAHPMDVGGAGAKYLGMRLAFAISPPATGLEY
jgi:hypothetical protein